MPTHRTYARTIGAIRITPGRIGEQGAGVFTQLPADGSFIVSNDDDAKNTVKIRYKDSDYLVFRKDMPASLPGIGLRDLKPSDR